MPTKKENKAKQKAIKILKAKQLSQDMRNTPIYGQRKAENLAPSYKELMKKKKKNNYSVQAGNVIIGNRDLKDKPTKLTPRDRELQKRYNNLKNN